MKVTRTLLVDVPASLVGICKAMGFVRADIWRRYGALGNAGKNAASIRKAITEGAYYAKLPVDGTIRAETTKDVLTSSPPSAYGCRMRGKDGDSYGATR